MTLMIGCRRAGAAAVLAGRRRRLSNLVRPEFRAVPSQRLEEIVPENHPGDRNERRTKRRRCSRKHEIKFVLAQFVDIHGAAKAKAVPVEHLRHGARPTAPASRASRCGASAWGRDGPDYMAVGDLVDAHADSVDAGLRAHGLQRHGEGQALSVLLARRAADASSRASRSGASRCTSASSPSSCC